VNVRVRLLAAAVLAALGAVPGSAAPPAPTGYRAEAAALSRLMEEARALARPAGCATAGQCRAVPIGARPCGGPRGYVVYCPLATDESALRRKIAEATDAERAFNRKWRLLSPCVWASEPRLVAVDGICRAAPPARPPRAVPR